MIHHSSKVYDWACLKNHLDEILNYLDFNNVEAAIVELSYALEHIPVEYLDE